MPDCITQNVIVYLTWQNTVALHITYQISDAGFTVKFQLSSWITVHETEVAVNRCGADRQEECRDTRRSYDWDWLSDYYSLTEVRLIWHRIHYLASESKFC